MNPFHINIAIDLCDEHAKNVRSLPYNKRKEVWDLIMNDEKIDILVRYMLDKDHKEHFI